MQIHIESPPAEISPNEEDLLLAGLECKRSIK